MNLSKLPEIIKNEPKFRAKQIKQAVYRDLISDWAEATTLPKELREELAKKCSLEINGKFFKSKDGTMKALVAFPDGAAVECVMIRYRGGRNTVCVSSQVGCPMGCGFCATGAGGFKRNLTADEIISQVLFWSRELKKKNERVSGVVFMGMGEPFLNYDEVMRAVRILNDQQGLSIGARHLSISTCGVIDGIKRMAEEGLEVNLAISLHAADNDLRSRLMPINDKYPLEKVISAVKDYIKRTNRKVMFEYLLLAGVNDSPEDAKKLAKLVKGMLAFVNIIPYNSTGVFERSAAPTVKKFIETLREEGIVTTERHRFGEDISAACGQLAIKRQRLKK